MVKRVAVIGVGASGLPAIKCCLDEGLEPTCFERTDALGGLWHFTEEAREGQACVMRSTVINASKEMMCYSDYPIPKEFPNFMPNEDVLRYFHMYADNFNLKKYIRFNTEVKLISRAKDFEKSGQWELTVQEKDKPDVERHTYDAVLLCTGHHADKKVPHFPGLEKFKGRVVHTHDYKDSRGLEGTRVVVVGIGNSGGDVAVELSRTSKKVYLSTRRGSWIFYRVFDDGVPVDMIFSRRVGVQIATYFPQFTIKQWRKKLNYRFDHKLFSLEPDHDPFSQHPTVNDDLPNRIISGSVVVKPDIAEVTETGVKFDDGTSEEDIDVIITATGYIFGFPFLEKDLIEVKNNKVDLYKYMFPPGLEKNTLAVIGCFQPLGAIMPISELQCRLATRVFKGDVKLPSREDMLRDIRAKQEANAQRYVDSTRHTIQVDYIPYMDELAEMNGCKPSVGKTLLTDPKLAYELFFGPCIPEQYRLVGPGAWQGARDAMMTTWDRMRYPLQTRPLHLKKKHTGSSYLLVWLLALLVVVVAIYLAFYAQGA